MRGRGLGSVGEGQWSVNCYYSYSLACVPLVLTKIPKVPGIMESITQPENQVLILAPFPTSLEILGSWLRVLISSLCFSPPVVRMLQA